MGVHNKGNHHRKLVTPAGFDGRRKFRAAVDAVMFLPHHEHAHHEQNKQPIATHNPDAKRKFRAAVYTVLLTNQAKAPLSNPRRKFRASVDAIIAVHALQKQLSNPRRKFRASVDAIIAAHALQNTVRTRQANRKFRAAVYALIFVNHMPRHPTRVLQT